MSNFIKIQSQHLLGPVDEEEAVINKNHIISVSSFIEDGVLSSRLSMIEIGVPIELNISAHEFKDKYLD